MLPRAPGIDLEMARLGMRFYRETIADLDLAFEFRESGAVAFFDDPAQEPLFREFAQARRRDGLEVELLDAEEARSLLPLIAGAVAGAVYGAEDCHIRTPMFVAEMARACRLAGVRIYEQTPVLRLLMAQGRAAGVNTVRGSVSVDHVVFATGAWGSQLLEQEGVSVPISPQRATLLQTTPVAEPWTPVTFGPGWLLTSPLMEGLPSSGGFTNRDSDAGSSADRWFGEIMSQGPDGRVFYGDTHEVGAGFDHALSAWALETLMAAFAKRFSHRSDLTVDRIWSGLIPRTPDKRPIVASVDALPGVHLVAGHYGGNLHGPASAMLITELIAGDELSLPIAELALSREALRPQEAVSA
jgi:glycine/D-amino acid oxidase-like deaminating enzyme